MAERAKGITYARAEELMRELGWTEFLSGAWKPVNALRGKVYHQARLERGGSYLTLIDLSSHYILRKRYALSATSEEEFRKLVWAHTPKDQRPSEEMPTGKEPATAAPAAEPAEVEPEKPQEKRTRKPKEPKLVSERKAMEKRQRAKKAAKKEK